MTSGQQAPSVVLLLLLTGFDFYLCSHHPNLAVLDLSDNHISAISGVFSLRLLACLNLDHNVISSVDGIPPLPVKELGLACNEISSLGGLSGCVHVEVLRIGSNGIGSLAGLESMKALRVRDETAKWFKK